MNKIKKAVLMFFALTIALSMNITVFAAEIPEKSRDFTLDDVTVTVTHEEMNNVPENLSMDFDSGNAVTRTVTTKNLGTSGSVNLEWKVGAEKNVRSEFNYKTNSEKMKVRLKGNLPNTSVTLKLYNTNGTEVASRTSVVGTSYVTFTFSNLSSVNTYYWKLYNNDQHDTIFSGTISAS